MKNKKTTYILIVLVVVVWGAIIYKVIAHVNGASEVLDIPRVATFDSTYLTLENTYELKLNYKDPFLKGNTYAASTTQKSSPAENSRDLRRRINRQNNTQQKPAINWPEIVFSGLIQNDKTHEELGLIQIGEASFLVREGDVRNDVELLSITADSIQVKYQDELKFVRKTY